MEKFDDMDTTHTGSSGAGPQNATGQDLADVDADIPFIDVHVHVLREGRHPSMRESMQESGCGRMVLLSLFHPLGAQDNPIMEAFGEVRPGETLNDILLSYKKLDPERFYVFGALDYGFDNHEQLLSADRTALAERLAGQPARLKDGGFDGCKLLESKAWARRVYPWPLDSDVYAGFFAGAEKEELPLMWHVGDPASFWDSSREHPEFAEEYEWRYTRPGDPQLDDLRQEALNVVERHPNLTAIFAHFFFMDDDLDGARAVLDAHPNVYFDTTQHWEMYVNLSAQREKARDFFIEFQDRILFGSDNVFGNFVEGVWSDAFAARNHLFMKQYFASDDEMPPDFPALAIPGFAEPGTVIRGLGLPEDVLQKLYHANFERIAGQKPRPAGNPLADGTLRATPKTHTP